MADAIALADLRFGYSADREILNIPALKVERGERIFLFGPSGSGKTTLLGIVAGVLDANSGRAEILGRDLKAMTSSQRDAFRGSHIGYIFQLFNLIPYLTVEENITLPCRLSAERRLRLNGRDLHAAAREVADHLGIGQLLGENVTRLSVGQQQRVAASRALIGSPELIVADEPTSSLDQDHRQRFIQLLFERCRQSGATLLFVSHDRTLMPMFDRAISLPEVNHAAAMEVA